MKRNERVLDEWLVIQCQLGDAASFEVLAERWHRRMLGRARHLTGYDEGAIDVTQEAWLAVIRGLPRLTDPARFPAWAMRIVANKSRDWVRRRQRRRRLDDQVLREPEPPATARPAESADGDAADRLGRAISALPDDRRAIVSMFYRDGLSVREIGRALEIPTGTVKSRLFHTRQQLRKHLEETS